MPNSMNCPKCGQPIAIPDGTGPSESLRCPTCDAEFLLSEATSDETAVPLEPPEADDDATAFAAWAPAAEGESLDLEPEVPEAEAETFQPEAEAPEPQGDASWLDASWPLTSEDGDFGLAAEEAPEAEAEPLELAPEPPDLVPEPPEAPVETFELAAEPPEVEAEGFEFAAEEPEVGAEGFELASEPPEAGAEAAEAGAEIYGLAGETPEPQAETPEADAEAVAATVRDIKARADELKARVDAIFADLAALEAAMGEAAGERPQLDVWKQVGTAPRIDTSTGGAAEMGAGAGLAPAGAFDFGAGAAVEEGAPPRPTVTGPRRAKKKKSAFFTLVEWVFGGVLGLLIAYYAINWIRGEQGNFLEIPLPGVPHTYKHCPEWWPGWLKPWADEEDPDSHQAAASEIPGSASREPAGQASAATPASSAPASAAQPPPRQFPPDYVGLANPPSYSPADLGTALKAAHASFGCPKCNSTGRVMQGGEEAVCPDCQGDPPEGLMPTAYGKFCRLAEVVTFLDNTADDPQTGPRKSAIADLLKKVGRTPANFDKVGYEAGQLCSPKNRDGNGILLAGMVTKLGTVDHANAVHVKIATILKTVIVVSKDPLPVQEGQNVFILGSIVDNPAKNLIGFKTPQPLVFWGGMAVEIEE